MGDGVLSRLADHGLGVVDPDSNAYADADGWQQGQRLFADLCEPWAIRRWIVLKPRCQDARVLAIGGIQDLVQDVVKWIQAEFPGTEAEDYVILEENVRFSLPEVLAGV